MARNTPHLDDDLEAATESESYTNTRTHSKRTMLQKKQRSMSASRLGLGVGGEEGSFSISISGDDGYPIRRYQGGSAYEANTDKGAGIHLSVHGDGEGDGDGDGAVAGGRPNPDTERVPFPAPAGPERHKSPDLHADSYYKDAFGNQQPSYTSLVLSPPVSPRGGTAGPASPPDVEYLNDPLVRPPTFMEMISAVSIAWKTPLFRTLTLIVMLHGMCIEGMQDLLFQYLQVRIRSSSTSSSSSSGGGGGRRRCLVG